MTSLGAWEHMVIGAVAGVTECVIMQPTVAIKNALQEGRPVPTNPLLLYRGVFINAASFAPITAIQFGSNRVYEQQIMRWTGELREDTVVQSPCTSQVTLQNAKCMAHATIWYF
jgi:hypothetical protein